MMDNTIKSSMQKQFWNVRGWNTECFNTHMDLAPKGFECLRIY